MDIKLTLPIPPSVNQAFSTNWKTKRRFSSKIYDEWVQIASLALLGQSRFVIKGEKWLGAVYDFHMPIYNKNGEIKKKDVANYEKCLSDFLEKYGIEGFRDEKLKEIKLIKNESDRNEVDILIYEI